MFYCCVVAMTTLPPHFRVGLLIDQYRKKAELYRTRFLVAPLGDDFRYETEKEVNLQFSNYEKMIDYVDSHPEMNVKVSGEIE